MVDLPNKKLSRNFQRRIARVNSIQQFANAFLQLDNSTVVLPELGCELIAKRLEYLDCLFLASQ